MMDIDAVLSSKPISPSWEMGAYKALWANKKATFKTIADCFRNSPEAMPSELVSKEEIQAALSKVQDEMLRTRVRDFGVRIHGSADYPERLRDSVHPIELLYYRGWWDLIDSPKRIAVVGSRSVSDDGIRRTRKLVKLLVQDG